MAANFWTSTHNTWLVPKERLARLQPEDRAKGLGHEALTRLKIHFTQYILDLAHSTQLRQHVAATAVVYFRRFYAASSFGAHDPRVIAPACLYLASKVEESLTAAKVLVATTRRLRHSPAWAVDIQQLLDAEMVVVEQLESKLVVYSPYLSLASLVSGHAPLAELGPNAWAALNDAYRTDLLLVWPPHLVALGALVLAAVVCGRDLRGWLAGLRVDVNAVYDIAMDLVDMYTRHRVPIGADEADQLLALVAPPARLPSAGGNSTTVVSGGAGPAAPATGAAAAAAGCAAAAVQRAAG